MIFYYLQGDIDRYCKILDEKKFLRHGGEPRNKVMNLIHPPVVISAQPPQTIGRNSKRLVVVVAAATVLSDM
jgi:hypothetical protein